MTPGDRVLNLFFYLFITLFAVISLIPFILVVSSSLTQEQALTANGYRLWPSEFSLDAYRLVMVSADIPQAYIVTIFHHHVWEPFCPCCSPARYPTP